jgi:hypothetical protein
MRWSWRRQAWGAVTLVAFALDERAHIKELAAQATLAT